MYGPAFIAIDLNVFAPGFQEHLYDYLRIMRGLEAMSLSPQHLNSALHVVSG